MNQHTLNALKELAKALDEETYQKELQIDNVKSLENRILDIKRVHEETKTGLNRKRARVKELEDKISGRDAHILSLQNTIKEREAEARSYRKSYNELKEVIICDEELKYDRGDIAYTVTTTSGTWSHKEALKYIINLKNKAIEEYINRTNNKYEKLKEENAALKEMLFKEKAKASARNAEKLKLLELLKELEYTDTVLIQYEQWKEERNKKREIKRLSNLTVKEGK